MSERRHGGWVGCHLPYPCPWVYVRSTFLLLYLFRFPVSTVGVSFWPKTPGGVYRPSRTFSVVTTPLTTEPVPKRFSSEFHTRSLSLCGYTFESRTGLVLRSISTTLTLLNRPNRVYDNTKESWVFVTVFSDPKNLPLITVLSKIYISRKQRSRRSQEIHTRVSGMETRPFFVRPPTMSSVYPDKTVLVRLTEERPFVGGIVGSFLTESWGHCSTLLNFGIVR